MVRSKKLNTIVSTRLRITTQIILQSLWKNNVLIMRNIRSNQKTMKAVARHGICESKVCNLLRFFLFLLTRSIIWVTREVKAVCSREA